MKKTLIALAVLAASGASFAQVTITGNVTMGYEIGTNKYTAPAAPAAAALGGDSSGFGTDTASLNFAATEDLGGGMKAAAQMNLAVGARAASAGEDASLALTTGVGVFTLKTSEIPDYLSGGVAGVGGVGMGGKVFSAKVNRDSFGVAIPAGPIVLSITHLEPAGAGLGLNAGSLGQAAQRINSISGTYSAGALVANLNYLMYDNQGATVSTTNNVVRTSAAYDLGVAKLGGGYVRANNNGGASTDDLFFAVSVPMGALTLSADWASRKVDGMDVAGAAALTAAQLAAQGGGKLDGTRTGYGLALSYALSKRTSLSASYARWDAVTSGNLLNNGSATTDTNLLLSHSF